MPHGQACGSSVGRAPIPHGWARGEQRRPTLRAGIIISVQAAPLSSQISQTDPPGGEHGRAGDLDRDEPLLHSDLRGRSRGWATLPQTIVAASSLLEDELASPLRATGAGRQSPHPLWAWPSPVGAACQWVGLRDGGPILTQPLMSPPFYLCDPPGALLTLAPFLLPLCGF